MGMSNKFKYKIGDMVKVLRHAVMTYQAESGIEGVPEDEWERSVHSEFTKYSRVPVKDEVVPYEACVVGAVRRQLGVYRKGTAGFDGEMYGAELKVTGTVMLYQVRKGMFGKIRDVFEEDLEPREFPGNVL